MDMWGSGSKSEERPRLISSPLIWTLHSCHSGSVMDLPFSYKVGGQGGRGRGEPHLCRCDICPPSHASPTHKHPFPQTHIGIKNKVDGSEEIIQVDNTQKAIGSLANAGLAYLMGNKTAAVACAIDGVGSLLFGNKTNEAARKRTEQENQSAADVVQIGGCRDDQTSADARINGADGHGCVLWGVGYECIVSSSGLSGSLTPVRPKQQAKRAARSPGRSSRR